MWVVLLSVIGGVVGLLFMVNEGMIGYMPDMQALSNPVDKFASQIVTSDGKLMGTYSYGATNRLFTEYDSIAPAMVEALVATEDERFYDHSGIDFRALLRAVVKRGVMGQKSAGGGSTITQQLAKNLFLTGERTWERKAKELGYAVVMEWKLGKDRILELYLNYAQWGKTIFGCEAASEVYYGIHCSELDMQQAINLAAMLASPGNHMPDEDSEFMRNRRRNIKFHLEKPQ